MNFGWVAGEKDVPGLGGPGLGYSLEATLPNFLLANFELLDFPSDGRREGIYEPDVLRDFEMSDFTSAKFANLHVSGHRAGVKPDPGENDFSQVLIWQTD